MAIAMILERGSAAVPSQRTQRPAPRKKRTGNASAAPSARPSRPRSVAPSPDTGPRLHFAILAGLAGQNVALGFHPAGIAGAGLRVGAWRVGASATYASASQAVAPGSVTVTLVDARVDVGVAALRTNHFRFGPLALFELGSLRGVTEGLAESGSGSRPWRSAGGGLALEGPLASPVGWRIEALAIAPLERESFSVRNSGGVYETPRVVGWFDLQLTLDLL